MKRKIISIDENLCNGCKLCVQACHENAIGMKNGKAVLLRDDYCDGLGDCLPTCPVNAISFEYREAAMFDADAVAQNQKAEKKMGIAQNGCPGSRARALDVKEKTEHNLQTNQPIENATMQSQLRQWPIQIKLVPTKAAFFENAKLLVAADCTAFSYANFHKDFIKDHVAIIGCPKLDTGEWQEKLCAIFKENNIKSITIARMEVPCCGGLENAVKQALQNSKKMIPWQVKVISVDGELID